MSIVMVRYVIGDRSGTTWRDKPRGKDLVVRACACSLRVSYLVVCFFSLRDLSRCVPYLAACLISLIITNRYIRLQEYDLMARNIQLSLNLRLHRRRVHVLILHSSSIHVLIL